METQIRNNAAKLSAAWQRRSALIMSTVRAATVEATNQFRRESVERMNAGIYNKPVPTFSESGASGGRRRPRKNAPLWKRTGNLKRLERQKVSSAEQGMVFNTAEYAIYRHNMPESLEAAGKKFRHGDRTAHWRRDTITDFERRGLPREIYRKHLRGMLISTQARG